MLRYFFNPFYPQKFKKLTATGIYLHIMKLMFLIWLELTFALVAGICMHIHKVTNSNCENMCDFPMLYLYHNTRVKLR